MRQAAAPTAKPTAVVAALGAEVAELRARLEGRRPLKGVDGPAWIGSLAGRKVVVGVCGPGPRRAGESLAKLLAVARPSRLLLIGVAGGLSPGLEVGQLIEAAELVELGGARRRPPSGWASESLPRGVLATVPRVVGESADKQALWERLGRPEPAAVDTETAVWAALADEHALPWRAVRAISDPAEESLPLDFNRFLDSRGGVSSMRVALHALPRPGLQRRLLELRRRVRHAAGALAAEVVRGLAP